MPYVSPSSPLPMNSQAPYPEWEMAASEARLQEDRRISRTGRERVYANTPSAASLWNLSPGLAADANYILVASEKARESVLMGMGPVSVDPLLMDPSNTALLAAEDTTVSVPVVISLNGNPETSPTALTTSEGVTMPAGAPQQIAGIWQGGTPKPEVMTRLKQLAGRVSDLGPTRCGLEPREPVQGAIPAWGGVNMPTDNGVGSFWLLLGAIGVGLLVFKK